MKEINESNKGKKRLDRDIKKQFQRFRGIIGGGEISNIYNIPT